MKKKILSVFIACVMVFALVPALPAGAEEVSIPISNRAELEAIADNLGGTYHLTADIVLSGAQAGDWVPLGSSTAPFTGTLDGRGFEIRWLRMGGGITTPSGPPNAGLFSHI
ncbi:MAG: hypothetical protein FWE60_04560, partial [Oscillospiraceae bacterium]|nr:hypothetical protein [Oscillospiraceae bacterium]